MLNLTENSAGLQNSRVCNQRHSAWLALPEKTMDEFQILVCGGQLEMQTVEDLMLLYIPNKYNFRAVAEK